MHQRTENCKKGAERKRWRLVVEDQRVATSRVFSAYGRPLEMVTSFRYLGRVISEVDNDWPAVVRNTENVQMVWRRMTRILSREGGRPRMSGFFFKLVVQSVLLFGADTQVVTPRMEQVLGGFWDQVARILTGRIPRWHADMKQEYNLAEVERAQAGFETMETYIRKRQNTVAQYIATRSILDLCESTERKQQVWVGMWWWEQMGIDLAGARYTAAAAAEAEEDNLEK